MTSLFEMFSPQAVARISAKGTRTTLPEGWSPVWENTQADRAYILVKGEVSVRHKKEEIARLGEGDIMGESAIVNHSLRNATLVALTKLELIHFTKDQVNELIEEIPSFKDALDKVAEERLGKS